MPTTPPAHKLHKTFAAQRKTSDHAGHNSWQGRQWLAEPNLCDLANASSRINFFGNVADRGFHHGIGTSRPETQQLFDLVSAAPMPVPEQANHFGTVVNPAWKGVSATVT